MVFLNEVILAYVKSAHQDGLKQFMLVIYLEEVKSFSTSRN